MSDGRPGGRSQWRRNGNKWAIGIAMAIGVGTSCYYLYKSLHTTSTTTNDNTNEKPLKDKSRCVVVTKSVVESQDTIPWMDLLQKEKELVLIVVPSCKDGFKLNLDPRIAYKVIYCDTTLGVWSCVKSLRKDEL